MSKISSKLSQNVSFRHNSFFEHFLNGIKTGDENKKEILKRRIRKDFYKVKQQLGLENYIINDLRFCQKCVNKI